MLDLAQCTIFDIYGASRIQVGGVVTADELSSIFIENWIPFMECHKCGKSSYCIYALPHPRNEHKKQEIRCGVAAGVIRNFAARTIAIAEALSLEEKQAYLDGAFYLTRFVLVAEQSIGTVLDVEYLEWYGDYAPGLFGHLTRIRDTLNSLNQNFKKIAAFSSRRSLLFVEGWAEKAFFERLRETHLAWFMDLMVECYDGEGNRHSKRIAMLLDKYIDHGYTIYVQGDADGKVGDIFKGLVDSGRVKKKNTFVFEHDFETAIPLPLLIRSMRNIGLTMKFRPSDLRAALFEKPRSVNKVLLENFGIDISRHKVAIANMVGEILSSSSFAWWADEEFMSTELGKFLSFVQSLE